MDLVEEVDRYAHEETARVERVVGDGKIIRPAEYTLIDM